ncbi:SPT2 chromatin protein isoform X2 [Tasmannia lanceolata]|uniref:SPT2 chromatin protein isoform X2 n=1 Tax=Tasmannia lanceolata TaxID=3420 RepID=UPI0040638329
MRNYDRADFHQRDVDSDEYEDYEELEEDGAEYEEDREEEDPKPTKEELEYLESRQRLKEKVRQRLKKESSAAFGNSQEKKKKPPNDNYGSFFGPSQPVIARRVLEERRSILETQHITAKVPHSHSSTKKDPVSSIAGAKSNVHDRPPKVANELKMKAQTLKDMRDYSFLLSDDAELPEPAKEPAPRKASVPSSDARPTHVPLKSKPAMSKPSRPVSNGREERNSISTNHQMQNKLGHQKVASASRSGQSADPRKLLGNNAGNGPGRPGGPKAPPPRLPVSSVDKKSSAVGINSSVRKAPSLKPISSAQKQYSGQRRDPREADKPKGMPTQPLTSSKPLLNTSSLKPQMKAPPRQIPSRAVQEDRPKKKQPVKRYSDEEDDNEADAASISRMIRGMFRYNPKKFAGDDDDLSDMDANFADIQKEERRSAKIAREEDERELRLIEEEEERLRAKKRKLGQR